MDGWVDAAWQATDGVDGHDGLHDIHPVVDHETADATLLLSPTMMRSGYLTVRPASSPVRFPAPVVNTHRGTVN